jgi:hypothetical protein
MLQEILRPAFSPIEREFLLHYYISAKSWPLVLLVGRPGVGKRRLFHLLAKGISGCSDNQIRYLPSQPSWQENTGRTRYIDSIQGRFDTMAFLDMLSEADTPGNEGRAYFLCLERATPEELDDYVDVYLAPRSNGPSLPSNLYLSAIVSLRDENWSMPAALLNRIGMVEVLGPLGSDLSLPSPRCPPVGWQRLFLRSSQRDPASARERLQQMGLLEAFRQIIESVRVHLDPETSPGLEDGLLLYAANSFTADGSGLLNEDGAENLHQAVDLQLAQWLLPCLGQQPAWTKERCEWFVEQLDRAFPRAHVRAGLILDSYARDVQETEAAAAVGDGEEQSPAPSAGGGL